MFKQILISMLLFCSVVTAQDWNNDYWWMNGGNIFLYGAPLDTVPAFNFTDVTEAVLASYNEASATFSSVNDSFYVTAGSDSFKIGTLGTLDVGWVKTGPADTLYISLVASASCSTAVTSTATAGGIADTWSVTTVTDDTPDVFTFTDITNAELSTEYQDSIIISGLDCPADGGVANGWFRVGVLGVWTSGVANGVDVFSDSDTVWVRDTSSASYSTTVNNVLLVDGVSDTLSITTLTASALTYVINKSNNKALLFKTGTYAIKLKD